MRFDYDEKCVSALLRLCYALDGKLIILLELLAARSYPVVKCFDGVARHHPSMQSLTITAKSLVEASAHLNWMGPYIEPLVGIYNSFRSYDPLLLNENDGG